MRHFVAILLSVLFSAFAPPSSAQSYSYEWETWYTDPNGQPITGSTGVQVCNSILAFHYPEHYAQAQFDRVVDGHWCFGDPSVLGGFHHELEVTKQCVEGGAGDACAPPTTCPANVGNPTNVLTDAKRQDAEDWISVREPRFSLKRTYLSDDSFTAFTTSNGGFASVWRLEVDSIVESAGSSLIRIGTDGSRHYFGLDSLSAQNGQTALRMSVGIDPDVQSYVATDASNTKYYYSGVSGASGYFLARKVWSDGYAITLVRDSVDGRILSIHDNRRQAIEVAWSTANFNGQETLVINSAKIDTNHDGATFVPEVEIDYIYSSNAFTSAGPGYRGLPLLTEVRRTDLALQATSVIAQYSYGTSATTFPPPLASVADGRLNAAGQGFSYASFGYADNLSSVTSMTTLSGHFGGADSFSFARTADTTTTTNALGKSTTYHFATIDGVKRVSQVDGIAAPDCLGTSKSFDYTPTGNGPAGFVYSQVERNGSTTTFTRNGKGLVLTQTEDALGAAPRITRYTWHATLQLPLTKTTSGLRETYTYDPDGLLLTYSQTDLKAGSPTLNQVRTWTYTYTTLPSGLKVLTAMDGPGLASEGVNDVTTYTYNPDGDHETTTDPNGLTTTILTRNSLGLPTSVQGPDLSIWSFSYDVMGRVLTFSFAVPGQTALTSSYTYDVIGQLLTATDTNGKIWTFTYNEARRLISSTSPTGDKVTYTYDAVGNVTKEEYSNGADPVTFWEGTEFDGLSRILKTTGAMGQIWSYSHDVEDNLGTVTDPLTKTASYAYDALNRMITTVDRENRTTRLKYDQKDRLTQYSDPRAIKTLFTYNGFGDVLTEVSADRGTITYTHDRRGLVTSRTDARGVIVAYTYDNGGRLTLIDYPLGSAIGDIAFTWDQRFLGVPLSSNKGKVGAIDDGTIRMEFGNRVIATGTRTTMTATYPAARSYTVVEDTDFEGNATRTVYPSGREIRIDYDDANRPSRIRLKEGSVFINLLSQMTYAPNGPLTSALYGDGYRQTRTYDLSYRLTRLLDAQGAAKLRDLRYLYEDRDNIRKITDVLDAAQTETFTYTPRESLKGAAGPYGTLAYTYDQVGNRLTASVDAAVDSYSYPATSNRLDLISLAAGGTRGFTYDASGNVIEEARAGGTYAYAYDAAGRMETFSINGFLQASYKYDAMGRQPIRTLTSPTPVTIHSVFDSQGRRIAEYDEATGALIREYVWNGWEPIAVIEGGVISFVRADQIGRPVFATNSSGTKVWSATYRPFGEVVTSTGALPANRFPGQWFQSESGLHQNWMRDYDSTTGRYLQADPLGLVDGASVYGYVKQNPGSWMDPLGEQTVPENIPGGPYSPTPSTDGRYFGPKPPKGPRPYCEYVPENAVKGSTHDPYWKQYDGKGELQRYDLEGNPITAEQAHPGNPPDTPNIFNRLLRIPFPLIMINPDLLMPCDCQKA